MKIGIKTINYFNFIVVGEVMLRTDRLDGMRWDEKTGQVMILAVGGKQYPTGMKDKSVFEEYIKPPEKKTKKTV